MVDQVTTSADEIRERLAAEVGRIRKDAPGRVCLTYPSPYSVAMSSLGFQSIYREIQAASGLCCERAFLADGADRPGVRLAGPPVSYETRRPLSDFPLLAFSVAYENELAGLVQMLDASGIGAIRAERGGSAPFILAGGPLTFSNPRPLAPFVDAIVMGEGEEIAVEAMRIVLESSSHQAALDALEALPHVFLPDRHDALAPIARCDDALLPATSTIRTPHTELSNMFLIETERGCSRGCAYCVMRRSTNGGMRIVPKETILERIPDDCRRVGLVGAAVSDHPKITEIVRSLTERGCEVGLSSLRPDRLKLEFVEALKAAGYRTLTTALDGPSERLRQTIERRSREKHFVAAAQRAREVGMDRLKLYLMVGLPTETDEDIDECARFVGELSTIVPVALGIAPFCPKRNTPLDEQDFAGVDVVESRLSRLRRGLKGRADVRATSARWAWIESVLAQGGTDEGLAVYRSVRAGGRFADYRREFGAIGYTPKGDRPRSAQRRLEVVRA